MRTMTLGDSVRSTISCAKDLSFHADSKLKFKSLYTDPNVRVSQGSAKFCVALPRVIPSY